MIRRRLIAIVLLAAGASLLWLITHQTNLSWSDFVTTLDAINPTMVGISCCLLVAVFMFTALKWKLVTEAQSDSRLGRYFYFRYVCLAVFIGQLLPMTLANGSTRAFAMKRREVMPVIKTTGLFIWDQAFDFMTLGLLAASGVIYLFFNANGFTATLCFSASICVVFLLMPFFLSVVARMAAFFSQLQFVPTMLREKFASLQRAEILTPQLARRLLLLSVGKFLTSALFYTSIIMAYGYTDILSIAFWGAPSAELAGVLSQMPGGLGGLDWTWVGILSNNGLSEQSAGALTLGIRCLLLSTYLVVTTAVWLVHILFSE